MTCNYYAYIHYVSHIPLIHVKMSVLPSAHEISIKLMRKLDNDLFRPLLEFYVSFRLDMQSYLDNPWI